MLSKLRTNTLKFFPAGDQTRKPWKNVSSSLPLILRGLCPAWHFSLSYIGMAATATQDRNIDMKTQIHEV